jgi:hypothetical protein
MIATKKAVPMIDHSTGNVIRPLSLAGRSHRRRVLAHLSSLTLRVASWERSKTEGRVTERAGSVWSIVLVAPSTPLDDDDVRTVGSPRAVGVGTGRAIVDDGRSLEGVTDPIAVFGWMGFWRQATSVTVLAWIPSGAYL